MNTETYNTGLALLKKLHGGHAGEPLVHSLQDICPDFASMTIEGALVIYLIAQV